MVSLCASFDSVIVVVTVGSSRRFFVVTTQCARAIEEWER